MSDAVTIVRKLPIIHGTSWDEKKITEKPAKAINRGRSTNAAKNLRPEISLVVFEKGKINSNGCIASNNPTTFAAKTNDCGNEKPIRHPQKTVNATNKGDTTRVRTRLNLKTT